MKVVAILQARMNSSRLPGKMLFDLAGAPLVQRVIERVKRATYINEVVLAFPSCDVDAFMQFSLLCSLYAYPLDENDLVGRYLSAAQAHGADIIVRIPCDNPCIQPDIIDETVQWYMHEGEIFTSTLDRALVCAESGKIVVDGLGCEVFSISRLKWLEERTRYPGLTHTIQCVNLNKREHPHLHFHGKHLVTRPWGRPSDEEPAGLRLDVNTQADYEFIKDIYEALYPINPNFSIHNILAYLDRKKAAV